MVQKRTKAFWETPILNDKFNDKPFYIGYNTGKGLARTAL
jgi:hypothetical protein